MSKNNCNGQCFEKFRGGSYELGNLPFYVKKNINCDCVLIKCFNYDICKNEVPEFLIHCFDGYCIDCYMKGNNKKFIKKSEIKEECSVCLENNYLYKLMNCNHYLCGDCIHSSYYPNYGNLEDYPIRPSFPYNNCEECEEGNCKCVDYNEDGIHTYFENIDDPKWLNDEKIQEWKKEDDWFELYCKVNIEEPKLSECPFCRKEQNY